MCKEILVRVDFERIEMTINSQINIIQEAIDRLTASGWEPRYFHNGVWSAEEKACNKLLGIRDILHIMLSSDNAHETQTEVRRLDVHCEKVLGQIFAMTKEAESKYAGWYSNASRREIDTRLAIDFLAFCSTRQIMDDSQYLKPNLELATQHLDTLLPYRGEAADTDEAIRRLEELRVLTSLRLAEQGLQQ